MINFQLKGNKLKIDDNPEISVWKELISEYDLKGRDTLTKEEYKKLMYRVMYNYSIHLLSKKDYFSSDLKGKLKKISYDSSLIESIVDELRKKGYIDDYAMAQQYIKNHEKYGRKKLEFSLKQKGINLSELTDFFEENIEIELNEIEKLLDKFSEKPLEKIITSLMRRGFEYKTIKLVLDRRK